MKHRLRTWAGLLDRKFERSPFFLTDANFQLFCGGDDQLRADPHERDAYGNSKWLTTDRQMLAMTMERAGALTLSEVSLMAYLDDWGYTHANLMIADRLGRPVHFPYKRHWNFRGLLRKLRLAGHAWVGDKEQRELRCVVLGGSSGANYYHFWTDTIADWWFLRQLGYQVEDFDYFVIPGLHSDWQKQVLEMAGIPLEKIWWNPDSMLPAYSLTIAYRSKGSARQIPPWIHRALLETVSEQLPEIDYSAVRKKIYISRGDSKIRRLRNETVLTRRLEALGVEVHHLSGTSVVDQVQLFRQADVIVAEHGAGLTNILWCQGDCTVIDIHSGSGAVPCYQLLSQLAGLQYKAVMNSATNIYENGEWNIAEAAVSDILETVQQVAAKDTDLKV